MKITRELLEKTRADHVRDLRLVSKMTDQQFHRFRNELRSLSPELLLSRPQAIDLLRLLLNLNAQTERELGDGTP